MTSYSKNAMRDRDFHRAKAIKTNSKYHWEMYKKKKNFLNKEVKKCKYYSDLINKKKGNPSELWKTFNEITSKKSNSTITSIEADGVLYTETNETAQALNKHFSRIGTKLAAKIEENPRLIASNSRKFFRPAFSRWNGNNKSLSLCSITESFVLKQLKTLKTNKAIGPDRICAQLLKDSAECMAPILTRLFNQSLETSTFPSIWKCASVAALFKGGDRTDFDNYRPITVLLVCYTAVFSVVTQRYRTTFLSLCVCGLTNKPIMYKRFDNTWAAGR